LGTYSARTGRVGGAGGLINKGNSLGLGAGNAVTGSLTEGAILKTGNRLRG